MGELDFFDTGFSFGDNAGSSDNNLSWLDDQEDALDVFDPQKGSKDIIKSEDMKVKSDIFENPKPTSKWQNFKQASMEKLEDPNFIQAMSELAIGLDPKGPGAAMGRAASLWSQNEALQKATAKQKGIQSSQQDKLMAALGEDNDNVTSLTFDQEGNVTTKGNLNPRKTPTSPFGTDKALEGIKSFSPEIDLGTEEGLTANDLKGLGPEALQILMQGGKRGEALADMIYKQKLGELKYGRETEAAKSLAGAKVEATNTERAFKRELETLSTNEKIRLEEFKSTLPNKGNSANEIALLRAQIANNALELNKQEFTQDVKQDEITNTFKEEEVIREQDLVKKEEKTKVINQEKEDREYILGANNKILKDRTPIDIAESAAKDYNAQGNSKYLVRENHFVGPDTMVELSIPKKNFDGVRVTSTNIDAMAESVGMSVVEFIDAMKGK